MNKTLKEFYTGNFQGKSFRTLLVIKTKKTNQQIGFSIYFKVIYFFLNWLMALTVKSDNTS